MDREAGVENAVVGSVFRPDCMEATLIAAVDAEVTVAVAGNAEETVENEEDDTTAHGRA